MTFRIIQGDNRVTLKTLADNSIDAIVTDPPYGIDFLGKSWDANTGALETYQECLRVLKPGGHILAFSAPRTYHHLAITLEQAGFEIRDQIMWIYSSGFPKSQDVGRQIQKAIYGKPDKQRFDPAIMIKVKGDQYSHPDTGKIYRKLPDINGDRLKKSHEGEGYGCVFEEVIDIKTIPQSGTNAFTTKGISFSEEENREYEEKKGKIIPTDPSAQQWSGWGTQLKPAHEPIALARKPIKLSIARNCQTHGVGALNIDATRIPTDDVIICGAGNDNTFNNFNAENNVDGPGTGTKINKDVPKWSQAESGRFPSNVVGEILQADYQKYFYCPKVSRKERHIGFDKIPYNGNSEVGGMYGPNQSITRNNVEDKGNNHPTVKPIELMKYLIKLITPPGGTVLDPFNGSGSTGCAAVELGFEYIGCELDPAYVAIAETRIRAWQNKDSATNNY
jgi:DNA modification methylase